MLLTNAGHEIDFAALCCHSQQHHLTAGTAEIERHLSSRSAAAGIDYYVVTATSRPLCLRRLIRVSCIQGGRSPQLPHCLKSLIIDLRYQNITRSRTEASRER